MNSFEKLCTVLICYVLLGRIWPEGKKLFYTWLFWCSVLCSAGQRATVQRESGLDVTGPGRLSYLFSYSRGVKFLGSGATVIFSAVLTVRYSLLMSDLVAGPNQMVIDEHRTDSTMAE